MNIYLIARLAVVVIMGWAFFACHHDARAEENPFGGLRIHDHPLLPTNLETAASPAEVSPFGHLVAVKLRHLTLPERPATSVSTLTIGSNAAGRPLECGGVYQPAEKTIIAPYPCGTRLALTFLATGVTQAVRVVGQHLAGLKQGAKVEAISSAVADDFGPAYHADGRQDGMVIRVLNPGENAANLPSPPVTATSYRPVLGRIFTEDISTHTENIYFEARGERSPGTWVAVWLSAVNRVQLGYQSNLHQVIHSGAFSWTLNGNQAMRERGMKASIRRFVERFEHADFTAYETGVLLILGPDMTNYHSTVCEPSHWNECHPFWPGMRFLVQLDHHKFYRRAPATLLARR